ncbi:DoxX family protein [Candidatus Woesearchaeota archaeon]|nr:MAG: DoxX family protein [Candidatus Woesearchaeota archaeon]
MKLTPQDKALLVLRIGLCAVFLWFGFSQLFTPQLFYGYLPQWVYNTLITPQTLIFVNGIFEIIAATLLLFGVLPRLMAGLLALHLIGIIISLGYNDVAVRDVGLMIATASLIFVKEHPNVFKELKKWIMDTARN